MSTIVGDLRLLLVSKRKRAGDAGASTELISQCRDLKQKTRGSSKIAIKVLFDSCGINIFNP